MNRIKQRGRQMAEKKSRKRNSILTEDQKKKHHIESEHKRRQAIRDAFDKLVDLVPELEPADARSEALILSKSSEFLEKLLKEHSELLRQLQEKNVTVPEELKISR